MKEIEVSDGSLPGMTSVVGIREVSLEELDEVAGGVLPAIGAGLALAAHIGIGTTTTSLAGHLISGASLGLAAFAVASYYGGSGGGSTSKPVDETIAK